MSGRELTPWFEAHVRPVRPGMYERDWGNIQINNLDYWDGKYWYACAYGEVEKREIWRLPANKRWRGLARRPR